MLDRTLNLNLTGMSLIRRYFAHTKLLDIFTFNLMALDEYLSAPNFTAVEISIARAMLLALAWINRTWTDSLPKCNMSHLR